MNSTLFFQIPDSIKMRETILKAVPDDWAWVDGYLHAKYLDLAQIETETGYEISRFSSIRPFIVGSYENEKRKKPNLNAMLVEQKLPGFVSFAEAGFENNPIPLSEVKQIIIGFLNKGYRGWLSFYSDYRNNHKYDNPAMCSFTLSPWNGGAIHGTNPESGLQPARVKLEWNEKHGGSRDTILRLIAVYRSLGLVEYTPEAN